MLPVTTLRTKIKTFVFNPGNWNKEEYAEGYDKKVNAFIETVEKNGGVILKVDFTQNIPHGGNFYYTYLVTYTEPVTKKTAAKKTKKKGGS